MQKILNAGLIASQDKLTISPVTTRRDESDAVVGDASADKLLIELGNCSASVASVTPVVASVNLTYDSVCVSREGVVDRLIYYVTTRT